MSEPRRLSSRDPGFEAELAKLLAFEAAQDEAVEQATAAILREVATRGDAALLEYTAKFDRWQPAAAAELELPRARARDALDALPSPQRRALETAASRIRAHHERQRLEPWSAAEDDGTVIGQRHKLEPAVTTLLNLAACREKANQLATAWGVFLDAERQTRSATDKATKQLNDVAKSRAQNLERRVSKLVINVPQTSQVDGLEIVRNKEPVASVMWNRALPIDGGTYTISAHAPGTSTWTTQVTIAVEGDTKTVDIPDMRTLPRDLTAKEATPPVESPPKDEPEPEEEPEQPAPRSKTVPIAVGAGAVALLGGAAAFHFWGNAKYDDAKAELADQSRRDALYDSANQKRFIAIGLGAAGLAAAGVSVWLFVRGGTESETAVARRNELVISPTSVSLVGTF